MDSYHLPSSILAFCHGRWDDQQQKYVANNSADIMNCCLEGCTDRTRYCFAQCDQRYGPRASEASYWEHDRCDKQCRELIKDCQHECLEYPSGELKIIENCAKKNGCHPVPTYDAGCLMSKENDIVNCCKQDCIPTHSDCAGQCQDFFEHLLRDRQTVLDRIADLHTVQKHNYIDIEGGLFMVPIGIAVGLLIFLGIYIGYKMK